VEINNIIDDVWFFAILILNIHNLFIGIFVY